MDQNEEIVQLLRDVRRSQQHEAELARRRWSTLVVALICGVAIALPAILSYLHRLLVYWL